MSARHAVIPVYELYVGGKSPVSALRKNWKNSSVAFRFRPLSAISFLVENCSTIASHLSRRTAWEIRTLEDGGGCSDDDERPPTLTHPMPSR